MSSSIYLATVTVQYTNNVGATVINIYNGTTRGMHVVALDRDVVSYELISNLYQVEFSPTFHAGKYYKLWCL